MVGAVAGRREDCPSTILLEVASERTVCDVCGRQLRRQRSSIRYPRGVMLGEPRVRYVEKKCVRCGKVYRPESYHQLVPPQGIYAFDLIVAVGLARFRQHRQNGEIQARTPNAARDCGRPPPRSTNWPIPFWTTWPPRIKLGFPNCGSGLRKTEATCFTWTAPANRAPTRCSTPWQAIAAGLWRARR